MTSFQEKEIKQLPTSELIRYVERKILALTYELVLYENEENRYYDEDTKDGRDEVERIKSAVEYRYNGVKIAEKELKFRGQPLEKCVVDEIKRLRSKYLEIEKKR